MSLRLPTWIGLVSVFHGRIFAIVFVAFFWSVSTISPNTQCSIIAAD